MSYSGALSCSGRIADMEDVNNSSVKLVVGLVAMLSYHYEWKGTQCSASGQWAQRIKLTPVTEKRKWLHWTAFHIILFWVLPVAKQFVLS